MLLPFLMFLIGAGTVVGAYYAILNGPDMMAKRRLDQRLMDMSTPIGAGDDESSVVKTKGRGPEKAILIAPATLADRDGAALDALPFVCVRFRWRGARAVFDGLDDALA